MLYANTEVMKPFLILIFLSNLLGLLLQEPFGVNAQTPILIRPSSASPLIDVPQGAIARIYSTDKGVLFPRLALQNVNSALPVATTPADGLIVYNTNAALTGGSGSGIYYWQGNQWKKLLSESGGENFWNTYGNTGINAASNFIGTTNDYDLVFMSKGIAAGRLGARNTAMGANGYEGVAGLDNTSFGTLALSTTSGGANTAFGYQTLEQNTTGTNNVAAGRQALWRSGTGSFNLAVGASNSDNANPGNFNVGIGGSAGFILANYTTGIGYYTGVGDNMYSIALGAYSLPDCNYCAVLGGTVVSPSPANSRVKVGIGTNFPTTDLEIRQNSSTTSSGIKLTNAAGTYNYRLAVDASADFNFYRNGTLRAYIEDLTGNYVVGSDKRLKKQISAMGEMLPAIMKLKPKTYQYKENDDNSLRVYGFLAQEVESVLPNLVRTLQESGLKGLDYSSFGVVAIKAIQEQQQQIERRNLEIDLLTKRLEVLELALRK